MKKMTLSATFTLGTLIGLCAMNVKADNMKLAGEVMAKGSEYTLVVAGKTYMLEANDAQKAELAKMNHKMAIVNGDVKGQKVMISSLMMAHMFTGEVMSKDGEYMLSVKGKNYMLKADDQQKAELAKMDHKTAMVSGDVEGENINVASVKMAGH